MSHAFVATTPPDLLEIEELFRRHLGEAAACALEDPCVEDVAINPDGQVFTERNDGQSVQVGTSDAAGVASAVRLVAHVSGRQVGVSTQWLTARLPWSGARFSAHLEPGVGGPAVTIRKHLASRLRLRTYLDRGALTRGAFDRLVQAIERQERILVAGESGCGKTTLLGALLAEVAQRCPADRVYAIEEVRELQIASPNRVQIESTREDFRGNVELAVRMRPKRLCVGEIRGAEALELVSAWTSGHEGGLATVHAGTAAGAVRRLSLLAEMAHGMRIPGELLADAVQLVVVMGRGPSGQRVVRELASVRFDVERGRIVTTGE